MPGPTWPSYLALWLWCMGLMLASAVALATPIQDQLSLSARPDTERGLLDGLDQRGIAATAWQQLRLADEHYRAGRLTAAIEQLEQAQALTGSPVLKVALGELYNLAGRHEDAIRIAREALASLPQSAQPHDIIGTAYLGLKKPELALKAYREVIAKAPDEAIGYHHLGDAYWALDRNADALAYYQEALKCDPGLVDARLKSAAVLLDLGQPDKSLEAARAALQQAPDSALAHAVLGEAQLARGELPQAKASFIAALARQPAHPYYQERLGEILNRQGASGDALAVLEPAAARDPTNSRIRRQLAQSYRQLGKTTQADYQMGLAAFLEKRPAEAISHYQAVLKVDPAHKGALSDLAVVYLEQRKFDEAIRLAAQAAALEPVEAAALSLLGQAQLGKGKSAEAEQSFRRAIQVNAQYVPAYLHLARLLADQRRCQEARQQYARAEQLGLGQDELRRQVTACR